jgi:hypothetical protein
MPGSATVILPPFQAEAVTGAEMTEFKDREAEELFAKERAASLMLREGATR